MKTRPAYLVIDTTRPKPAITRVTQSWPSLAAGELVVRVALELPDELMPNVQTLTVDDVDRILAIEQEELELDVTSAEVRDAARVTT